eukprot:2192087-Prymnesium_polylepis.1
MASQMLELVKAQSAMSQSMGTLAGQVSSLMSEVSKLKNGGGMGGGQLLSLSTRGRATTVAKLATLL